MKLYATVDLVSGVRAINSPDPVNPQDAATKAYVDRLSPVFSYWEVYSSAAAGGNSYTGGWAYGTGLPPPVTINKLYVSTRIRVKLYNVVAWATSAQGNVYYGAAVNGGPVQVITRMFFNRLSTRIAFPYGATDFIPPGYSQVNATGNMTVNFYVMTDAGLTWNVDAGDSSQGPQGIISEMP